MPAPIAQGMPIYKIADMVVERIWSLLQHQQIAKADIDVIRSACAIAAHYELMDANEYRELEDKTLRKLIGKVG